MMIVPWKWTGSELAIQAVGRWGNGLAGQRLVPAATLCAFQCAQTVIHSSEILNKPLCSSRLCVAVDAATETLQRTQLCCFVHDADYSKTKHFWMPRECTIR